MIKHIKRLLGIGQEPVAPAPYKVETPVIQDAPAAGNFTKEEVQSAVKAAKKPAVKAKTAAKPRKPKAPKA
jgi:hypothetical protein